QTPGFAPGIAATHDGGQTWKVHTSTAQRHEPYVSLACPTVTRCYATGGEGLATTADGGRTWTERTTPAVAWAPGYLPKITCPGASMCYVTVQYTAGLLWRTTDGGTAWTRESSATTNRL